jgi:hypothetical protein
MTTRRRFSSSSGSRPLRPRLGEGDDDGAVEEDSDEDTCDDEEEVSSDFDVAKEREGEFHRLFDRITYVQPLAGSERAKRPETIIP